MSESAETYRAQARELEERAKSSDDWKRQALLSVAKRWRDFADEIERFEIDQAAD